MTDTHCSHPMARNAIVRCLLAEGFTRADANIWGNNWAGWPDLDDVACTAIAYDDHGVPAEQAVDWNDERFLPHEALRLYDIGWTPAEAAWIRDLLPDADCDITDWANLKIPPARVAEYLAAGMTTYEVATLEESQPPSTETLSFMAAFRA